MELFDGFAEMMKHCFTKCYLSVVMCLVVSCTGEPFSADEKFFFQGDSLCLLCGVMEKDADYGLMSHGYEHTDVYYTNRKKNVIVDLCKNVQNGTTTLDTIIYVIKDDSIINETRKSDYLLVKNRRIAKGLWGHKRNMRLGYVYDKEGCLIKTGIADNHQTIQDNISSYVWENGRIISIRYFVGEDSITNCLYDGERGGFGTIELYICQLLNRDALPFIVLGYYGHVPNYSISQTYTLDKVGRIRKDRCYNNYFGKDGMLNKVEWLSEDGNVILTRQYIWGERF